MRERQHIGLECLEALTILLQRVRSAHPTFGSFEAADFQWWWRTPRSTDSVPQLFWYDDTGQPSAAMIATAWRRATSLAPIVMPDATPDWTGHVIDRGLAHAASVGLDGVEMTVDGGDAFMIETLGAHGFEVVRPETVETWMDAVSRPGISDLRPGYRPLSRPDTVGRPHHMTTRSGERVEERLLQTSLYRPDLDLVVLDPEDRVAAFGLFWFDPVTETGLVEPMRTEDAHQRLGLARHVLTTGLDRLANAGASRIKIVYEPDNTPARRLYLSVGFRPVRECVILAQRNRPDSGAG